MDRQVRQAIAARLAQRVRQDPQGQTVLRAQLARLAARALRESQARPAPQATGDRPVQQESQAPPAKTAALARLAHRATQARLAQPGSARLGRQALRALVRLDQPATLARRA